MWSLDAGEFRMPPNVSLAVGGNSTVQHLVLQVQCPSHFMGYDKGAEAGVKSNNFNNPWNTRELKTTSFGKLQDLLNIPRKFDDTDHYSTYKSDQFEMIIFVGALHFQSAYSRDW